MKKSETRSFCREKLYKPLLAMKITLMLIVLNAMQLSASVYSQNTKFDLNMTNQSLVEVFKEIRNNSDFTFVYDLEDVETVKNLDIDQRGATVEEILDNCLQNTNLSYEIVDKVVIVKQKPIVAPKPIQQEKKEIHGSVMDTNGIPLPGVSVVVKGTMIGVITDIEGNYTLEVSKSAKVLVFTFVGMQKKEMLLTENISEINVVLQEDVSLLGEVTVVSTGYQTIQKEKVTGAIVSIGAKELETKNVTNLAENLEGTVPGLVRYNGKTTIRGIGTLNANENILLVVDGLPVEGDMKDINPYDVESVTVLKDAAATAIYGARASNGVIVVVTKKARGKDQFSVEVSGNLSYFEKPDYSKYGYMTSAQQVDFESKYYDWFFNGGKYGTVDEMVSSTERSIESGNMIAPIQYAYYQLAKGDVTQEQLNARLLDLKKNDFYEEYREHALQNQIIQQYNIAVRSNNDRSESNLVVNYKDDNSGIINAYNKQLNISYRGKFKPAKWLDFNYGANMVIGKTRSHGDYNASTPFNVPSYYNLYNENGEKAYYSLSDFNVYSSYNDVFESNTKLHSLKYNHLDELDRNFSNTTTRNNRYFIHLNIKPLPGLTIEPQFQYEDNHSDTRVLSESESYFMRKLQNTCTTQSGSGTAADPYVYKNLLPEGGRLLTSNQKSPSYTFRTQVNYTKEFGKHDVSIIAGTEFRQTRSYGTRGGLFGYNDQLQVQSTSSIDFNALSKINSSFWNFFATPANMFRDVNVFGLSTDTKHRYASGYANFTYTFDEKYNVFGSVRKDYADLFGGAPKFRGSPLWSTGLAWNISNEDFMKDKESINFLKLRVSYGVTGNISTDYTSRLTASITGTQLYTNLPIASIKTPPNAKLRWEKTSTINIGFDLSMFDYRLKTTFDWYRKEGSDLLAKKRLDVTQGYSTQVINNGDMLNKGVELSLSYDWIRPVKENGFAWSSTLNLSRNKNEITKVDDIVTTPYALAGSGTFKKGCPVNSLFSYQYKGLDETGLPQYLLSDGTLTTDELPSSDIDAVVFSGSKDPKMNISLNNQIAYKGFSIGVFAVYYGGHYFRDNAVSAFSSPGYGPLPAYLLNSWTPENTNTDIPGAGQYYRSEMLYTSDQLQNADRWVKHADFIKIRNIVFAYELPKSIAEKIKASSIKLRFQIDNPKTVWTRDNLQDDPETGSLPIPTSYVFGVNLNF
ncbi:MAG: SusC/RagA family TonB-linked outer membrane protein [Marinifilaceae bacterium]|nr:SusC/RagA family TonB-linked outer membrane protein [Marinifilaceae bacterium]